MRLTYLHQGPSQSELNILSLFYNQYNQSSQPFVSVKGYLSFFFFSSFQIQRVPGAHTSKVVYEMWVMFQVLW